MTATTIQPHSPEIEEAIRLRIVKRASDINTKLLARLTTAEEDLALGRCRDALGGLDGMEKQIHIMRSLLHLAL